MNNLKNLRVHIDEFFIKIDIDIVLLAVPRSILVFTINYFYIKYISFNK